MEFRLCSSPPHPSNPIPVTRISSIPAGLRDYKFSLYEGGHRMFMFIHWPDGGISSQNVQEIDALTHVSDLFPTLLGQAGIPIDPGLQTSLDGISLELLLSGSPDDQFSQRTIFHQLLGNSQDPVTGAHTPLPFANFGVLTSAWRLVHPLPAIAGDWRLYAASDRFQETDVAASQHGRRGRSRSTVWGLLRQLGGAL